MEPEPQRTLIVAAHPDDETIGAGIWMARHPHPDQIAIVHVTDGAPGDFPDREQYARTRRRELLAAVALAGIRPEQCLELGFTDKEAWLHMPELVERLSVTIERFRPELILAHPAEGGHPDHDAAAFGVAQALDARAVHWEFASYHAGPNGIVTGEFLGAKTGGEAYLTRSEQELKRAMFDCFVSQREVLKMFSVDREPFRRAPIYDFTEPPHAGRLQYEIWGFAMGEEWRRRATEALNRKVLA